MSGLSLTEDDRVGLWLNLERQRQRRVSEVREAVEAARDNSDPPDEYFEALADSHESAEMAKYWDLTRRSDRRMKEAGSPLG